MSADKILLDWGAEQGLVWDASTTGNGDAFGARFESYRTDTVPSRTRRSGRQKSPSAFWTIITRSSE